MAETKPAKVPRWNDTGTNRTEPTEPEKDSGWALNDQPPSSYFNWLQHYAGAWLRWFNERAFDGPASRDFHVQGVDETGTDADGGSLILAPGRSTGTGKGDVELKAVEGETGGSGSGSYVNDPVDYATLDGANKRIETVKPLYLNNGADTVRGDLQFVSSTEPTGPAAGDVYFDSATDQLALYDGSRYHNLNPVKYDLMRNNTVGRKPVAATTAHIYEEYPVGVGPVSGVPVNYKIPASSLRPGSIIKVAIAIDCIAPAGSNLGFVSIGNNIVTGPGPWIGSGGGSIGVIGISLPTGSGESVYAETQITCVSLGSPGVLLANGRLLIDNGGVVGFGNLGPTQITTIDTAADIDVYFYKAGTANDFHEVGRFLVEVI